MNNSHRRKQWQHYSRACAATLVLSLGACVSVPPQRPPAPTPSEPAPPPPSAVQYQAASWQSLPGWKEDRVHEGWGAFLNSCKALATKEEWKSICEQAQTVSGTESPAVRRFFEQHLVAYRIVPEEARASGTGGTSGLVTGYYEPILDGARSPSARFRVPLYAAPEDLLTVELSETLPELKGKRVRGRLVGKRVLPYYTRAELSVAVPPTLKPLAWVDDPIDAFFFQVQGSGRLRLNGKETIRLAYADQNGHPYKSIGRYLVDKGELPLSEASAQGIRAWLKRNPQREQELLNVNPSVVFFKEEKLDNPEIGPKGALGVPLTPGRSIAIDRRFVPLGAPLFLATTQPLSEAPLRRLVMGQDTGGAITGPLRADFFWGWGKEAGEIAGRMRQPGELWLLWPKQAGMPRV